MKHYESIHTLYTALYMRQITVSRIPPFYFFCWDKTPPARFPHHELRFIGLKVLVKQLPHYIKNYPSLFRNTIL